MTAEQFVDAVWQLTGAAPKTIDAPLVRGLPNDSSVKEVGELQGRWIWSASAKQPNGPAAGEKVVFRKKFAEFDKDKQQEIQAVDFPQLLQVALTTGNLKP
jgi:hypothetical protein